VTRLDKGSCFCGSVEIEVSGTPDGMGYCHCASCRAWPAGPVDAVTLWRQMSVRVIKGAELLAAVSRTPSTGRQFGPKSG
jgi:hypothetical protein